jgi:hypothetical protein
LDALAAYVKWQDQMQQQLMALFGPGGTKLSDTYRQQSLAALSGAQRSAMPDFIEGLRNRGYAGSDDLLRDTESD